MKKNNEFKMLSSKEEKILLNFENVDSIIDLIGDDKPSKLFYIIAEKLNYLLSNDIDKVFDSKSMERRNYINKLIKLIGPLFLQNKQVFEDRNELLGKKIYNSKDIKLGEDAVIWASNHHFKDDALGTVLAAYRNAYILFGSLPQFYNTFDGITAWLNGVILLNRKNNDSKKAVIEKCNYTINQKKDLIIYPEGVWCKSPNELMLDLWPGIYRICKDTGCKVVPVSHYIRDCESKYKENYIHTVVDEPIRLDDLSEKAALEYLKEIICTWYYLMMEKYGKSTREEELRGYTDATEAWEDKLIKRLATTERYDSEIEICADYLSKEKAEYYQAWNDIANIKNISSTNICQINAAKKIVKNNFQRRF